MGVILTIWKKNCSEFKAFMTENVILDYHCCSSEKPPFHEGFLQHILYPFFENNNIVFTNLAVRVPLTSARVN